ncbi:hypothetical protein [Nevskia soli]|uniref:hypothetical protein n=1 Tax=Nevskia soli TaxID=418856 RepID=UPI0004A75AFE|nr:hypothetical protein [Nevskia soli]
MKFSASAWLLANLAGAVAFLIVASHTWVEPELTHLPGAAGGGAVVWVLGALPILLGFVLIDLGILVSGYLIRRASRPIARASLAALAVWFAAFILDTVHHGI